MDLVKLSICIEETYLKQKCQHFDGEFLLGASNVDAEKRPRNKSSQIDRIFEG